MDGRTASNSAGTEPKTRDSALAWFKAQQGNSIETDEASAELLARQKAFVERSLQVLNYVDSDVDPISADLRAKVEEFQGYRDEVTSGRLLDDPTRFRRLQTAFYRNLHENPNIAEEDKLGLEFLLGLTRFSLAADVTLEFAQYMRDEKEAEGFVELDIEGLEAGIREEGDFFRRLAKASDATKQVIDAITKTFLGAAEGQQTYWQASEEFFGANPEREELAKQLVSIQYVPEEVGFLGMAQFLHWNGFGGDGTYLQHEKLQGLQDQRIGYHGQDGGNTHQNFAQRLQIFGRTLGEVKEYAKQASINALQDRGEDGEPIRIYDFCTGPHFGAVAGIAEELEGKGKKVALTLSDVDGSNLKTLADKKRESGGRIEDVRYEDLNIAMRIPEGERDKYDLVSAAIGMHQLSEDGQRRALQHFTGITKVGGIASIPHVNEKVHTQLMLIPANIVDRESYVSDDVLFNFEALAVPSGDGDNVKVPYPLRNVNIPGPDSPSKAHLYDYTMYTVVEMSKDTLREVQERWNAREYDRANALVTESTGVDIAELEKTIAPSKEKTVA